MALDFAQDPFQQDPFNRSADRQSMAPSPMVPSLYTGFAGHMFAAPSQPSMYGPSPFAASRVTYADRPFRASSPYPAFRPASGDPLVLDSDPFGTATKAWASSRGYDLGEDYVGSLNVFGRVMSREQLEQTDAGRRLLETQTRLREGRKRGFLDALLDIGWADAPFVSLFATVGNSFADAALVSGTMRKLQNGEPVTDEELIKTRLYMAEQEYQETGGVGAMIGDIIRQAPGFVVEFIASDGLYSVASAGARKALSKSAAAMSRLGLRRATKMAIDEAAEKAAAKTVSEAVDVAVKKAASEAASEAANTAAKAAAKTVTSAERDAMAKGVWLQMAKKTERDGLQKTARTKIVDATWKDVAADLGYVVKPGDKLADLPAIVREVAEKRAKIALDRSMATHLSNTTLSRWWNGTQRNIVDHLSRGLIDYGRFGSGESWLADNGMKSATTYLADALGTFFVEAPVRGARVMLPGALAVRPLVESGIGADLVTHTELSLQARALETDNRRLMDDAHAIGLGTMFLEYASESSGRGFRSLFKSFGRMASSAAARYTGKTVGNAAGKTVVDGALDAAEGLVSGESMHEAGGWLRRALRRAFGGLDDTAEGLARNKAAAIRSEFRGLAAAAEKRVQDASLSAAQKAAAAAEYRELSALTESGSTALQKFVASGNAADLGSAAAQRIVESRGGAAKFIRSAMKNALNHGDPVLEPGLTFRSYAQFWLADKMFRMGWTPESTLAWLRTAGYDGIFEEMMEERYSDFAKGLFGLDERAPIDKGFVDNLKQAAVNLWPGWDQLVAEAVGFSIPMGVTSVVGHVNRAAAGSALARLQYFVELVRGLHAGAFVETKTSDWFAESREREADILDILEHSQLTAERRAELVAEAADESKSEEERAKARRRLGYDGKTEAEKAQLNAALAALRKQRARVSESIGGAAQEISEKIRYLEAVNTQVSDAGKVETRETPTAEASARAAAVYEYLVENAGDVGRTLTDLATRHPLETSAWWKRVAARVTGFLGAMVTGHVNLAAWNPAAWSMADAGISPALAHKLIDMCRHADFRAADAIRAEAHAGIKSASDIQNAALDELRTAKDTMDAVAGKYGYKEGEGATVDGKKVDDLEGLASAITDVSDKTELTTAMSQFDKAAEKLASARDEVARMRAEWDKKNGAPSHEEVRARSRAEFDRLAGDLIRSYMSRQGIKFYQQTDVKAVAERQIMLKYQFTPGEAKTIGGVTVSTTQEFFAVPEVQADVADRASRITQTVLSIVDNRLLSEMGTAETRLDRRYGNALVNIPVDSPLYDRALLAAAMEVIGYEDMFEVDEMSDYVSLSQMFSDGALPATTVDMVAALYDKAVRHVGTLTEADQALIDHVAHVWRYSARGLTPEELETRNARVVALAKKLSGLRPRNVVTWAKPRDPDAVFNAPGEDLPVDQTTARREPAGSFRWNDPDTGEVKTGTQDEMNEFFTSRGFSATEPKVVLGNVRYIGSRSAAQVIDKLGLLNKYLNRHAKGDPSLMSDDTGAAPCVDPRFRLKDGVRKYTPEEADRVRIEEVTRANRFHANAMSDGRLLPREVAESNYGDDLKAEYDTDFKMYQRVYGTVGDEGTDKHRDGYITVEHALLRDEKHITVPDPVSTMSADGPLVRPHANPIGAYRVPIRLVTPLNDPASMYVFMDLSRSDATINRMVAMNMVHRALLSRWRDLAGPTGGQVDGAYSAITHAFVRRTRQVLQKLAISLYEAKQYEAGKEAERLYERLFAGNGVAKGKEAESSVVTQNTLSNLIVDIVMGQIDRDIRDGSTYMSPLSPMARLSTEMRGTREFWAMLTVVDYIFGGTGFAIRPAKDAPLTGMAWAMDIMEGGENKDKYRFLTQYAPEGMDRRRFAEGLARAFEEEVAARTGAAAPSSASMPSDSRISDWFLDVLNRAKLKSPAEVDNFLARVMERAGVKTESLDKWDQAVQDGKLREARRIAEIVNLKTRVSELEKELQNAEAKVKKLEGQSQDSSAAAAAAAQVRQNLDSVKEELTKREKNPPDAPADPADNIEVHSATNAGESKMDMPPSPDKGTNAAGDVDAIVDEEDPSMPGFERRDGQQDFNALSADALAELDAAARMVTPQEPGQPDGSDPVVDRPAAGLASTVSPSLSDLSDDKRCDEVLAAAKTALMLVATLHPEALRHSEGALADAVRSVLRRTKFLGAPSDVDVEKIVSRCVKMVGFSRGGGTQTGIKFVLDMVNAEPDAVVPVLQAFFAENAPERDNGSGTRDSEKFGDKALSAFQALNPFATVLSMAAPWTGKNLQGFLTVSRNMLADLISAAQERLARESGTPTEALREEELEVLMAVRELLTRKSGGLGGADYEEQEALHASYVVDKFGDGSDAADERLARVVSVLAGAREGQTEPLSPSLATFFAYLASLPPSARAAAMYIVTGMAPAGTVSVSFTPAHVVETGGAEFGLGEDSEDPDAAASVEWEMASYSIRPTGGRGTSMVPNVLATPALALLRTGGLHAVRDAVSKLSDMLRASTSVKDDDADSLTFGNIQWYDRTRSGGKVLMNVFQGGMSDADYEKHLKSVRGLMMIGVDTFERNCDIAARVFAELFGEENTYSVVLRSRGLRASVRRTIASGSPEALNTVLSLFRAWSKADVNDTWKTDTVPYAFDEIVQMLNEFVKDCDAHAEWTSEDQERRLKDLARETFTNGDTRTGDVTYPTSTMVRTGEWTTVMNKYTAALPQTVVKSDLVENRSAAGDRPSVAVSQRGTIPIVERWGRSTMYEDGVKDASVPEDFTFRAMALAQLDAEFGREYDLMDQFNSGGSKMVEFEGVETRDDYIARETVRLALQLPGMESRRRSYELGLGDSAPSLEEARQMLVENSLRTLTWPGRSNRRVVVRNTATVYRHDELVVACATQFASDKRDLTGCWYVPLYAGDHSSCNLLQLPVFDGLDSVKPTEQDKASAWKLLSFVYRDSVNDASVSRLVASVARYMAAARRVNEALGVSLMGQDAKRSAISSADAEQVPLMGATFDLAFGGEGNVRRGDLTSPQNVKFGEARIAIAMNTGVDPETGLKYNNEELKGLLLASGFGVDAFRKMSKNPDSTTHKLHFIGHGYNLGFLKAATQQVRFSRSLLEGDGQDIGYPDALARHLLGFFGSDEASILDGMSRSTVVLADLDSYKVGVANSKLMYVETADGPVSLLDHIRECVTEAKTRKPELYRKLENGQSLDAQDVDELVGELKWVDKIRGDAAFTDADGNPRAPKVSDILEGVMVRAVDNVARSPGAMMITVSYVDNTMMAIRAANIAHDAAPEVRRFNKNYTIDMFAKIVDQSEGLSSDDMSVQTGALDVLAGYSVLSAVVATHSGSVDADISSDARVLRELAASGRGPGDGLPDGIPVADKKHLVAAARLRKALLAPMNKVDAVLVASGSHLEFDKSTGTWTSRDQTESKMRRKVHEGSITLPTDDDKAFYGAKLAPFLHGTLRRLGLVEATIRSAGFRYGMFLDQAEFDRAFGAEWNTPEIDAETDSEKRAVLRIERVVTMLRDAESGNGFVTLSIPSAEGEPTEKKLAALEVRRLLAGSFLDHHGTRFSQHMLREGLPMYRYTCFEDLFTADGRGGRTFDRTAVHIGEDKVPITKYSKKDGRWVQDSTEPMIFLAGTAMVVPRTPSANGSPWLQAVRASFPVSGSEEAVYDDSGAIVSWRLKCNGLVALDMETLHILGCDNDGDEAAVYLYDSVGGHARFVRPDIMDLIGGVGKDLVDIDNKGASDPSLESRKDETLAALAGQTITGEAIPDRPGEGASSAEIAAYKSARSRAIVVDSAVPDGEGGVVPGYAIPRSTAKIFSNSITQSLLDMARQLKCPAKTDPETGLPVRAKFVGHPDPSVPNTGFNGVESPGTAPRGLDDADKWKAFIADECPPDVLSEIGTISDLWAQLITQRSAEEANSARASMVAISEHFLTAFTTGLFDNWGGHGESDRADYGLFPHAWALNPERARENFLSFMRYVAGFANMTFDDVKERICSRFGLSREMVDTFFADLLDGRGDGRPAWLSHLPESDADMEPRLRRYVRSVRDKDRASDGKWVSRIDERDPGRSRLSLDKDWSRLFMYRAAGDHIEDTPFRQAVQRTLFGGQTDRLARLAELMKRLGVAKTVSSDGHVEYVVRTEIRTGTVRRQVAEAFAAELNANARLPGCSPEALLSGLCSGSVSSGFTVGAGYLTWILGAAYGSLNSAHGETNYFGSSIPAYEDPNVVASEVRAFFRHAHTTAVLADMHAVDGGLQFVQVDPGDLASEARAIRASKALARVVASNSGRDGTILNPRVADGTLRRTTVNALRRVVKLALSGSVRAKSAVARAVEAREAIAGLEPSTAAGASSEGAVDTAAVDVLERARQTQQTADLLRGIVQDLTSGVSDLLPDNARTLADSMRHVPYIPAAAQVIARIGGGGLVSRSSDLFRLSEHIARGAQINSAIAGSRGMKTTEGNARKRAVQQPFDILHFRRGCEAILETLFVLASTSEEGKAHPGMSYLYSVREKFSNYGAGSYAASNAPSQLSGKYRSGNWLYAVRALYNIATPSTARDMQNAILDIVDGALDARSRTSRFAGSADKSAPIGTVGDGFSLTHANLEALLAQLPASNKKSEIIHLRNSVECVLDIIDQIADARDANHDAVRIAPSEVLKVILPWYTVVMEKVDGAPGYDAFSGSLVNYIPNFFQLLDRQQALNDRLFEKLAEKARKEGGENSLLVNPLDLWAATNNAPVKFRESVERTKDLLREKRKENPAGRADPIPSDRAIEDAIVATLKGGDAAPFPVVIVRGNPRARYLVDIFRSDLAERITGFFDSLAAIEASDNAPALLAEAERQKELQRKRVAEAAASVAAADAQTPIAETANAVLDFARQHEDDVRLELGKMVPDLADETDPAKAWQKFTSFFGDVDQVCAKWKRAGVPAQIANDHAYAMFVYAREAALLNPGSTWLADDPEGRARAESSADRGVRAPAESLGGGTGALESLLEKYESVVVMDTETTGLGASDSQIVQIGATKIVRGPEGTTVLRMKPIYVKPVGFPEDKYEEIYSVRSGAVSADDIRNGGDIATALSALWEFAGERALMVAHNAAFDMSMLAREALALAKESHDASHLRSFHSYDWLDTQTVAKDRVAPAAGGRKGALTLETLFGKYGNTAAPGLSAGSEGQAHNADKDVDMLTALLSGLDRERADLLAYVNRIGFMAGRGLANGNQGAAPASAVYGPQSYARPGQAPVSAASIFPVERGGPDLETTLVLHDVAKDPPAAEEKPSPVVHRFANALRKTLGALQAKGSHFSVTVDERSGAIIVERDFVGQGKKEGNSLSAYGGKVRTVVRIEVGSGRASDKDGLPLDINVDNENVVDSLLAMIKQDKAHHAELQEVTTAWLMKLSHEARRAFFDRYAPGSTLAYGYTMPGAPFKVDAGGMMKLVSGIRLGAGVTEKTLFHEYFHAALSMLEAIGALTDADFEALAKRFPAARTRRGGSARSAVDEEKLAYAFGDYAYKLFQAAKDGEEPPDATGANGVLRKIWTTIRTLFTAMTRAVVPSFSYADDAVMVNGTEIDTRDILFNTVLSGRVVMSEGAGAHAEMSAALHRANVLADEARVVGDGGLVHARLSAPTRRATAKASNPSGETVLFDENQHRYWSELPDGRVLEYASGSTLYDLFKEPFDPEGRKDWWLAGAAARSFGTRVHAYLQARLSDLAARQGNADVRRLDAPQPLDARMEEAFRAADEFVKFLEDGGYQVLAVEKILFDPESGIAGTVDLVLRKGDTIVLVDHKTNGKTLQELNDAHGRSFNLGAGFAGNKCAAASSMNGYLVQLALYSRLLKSRPDLMGSATKVEVWIDHVHPSFTSRKAGSVPAGRHVYTLKSLGVSASDLSKVVDRMLELYAENGDGLVAEYRRKSAKTHAWPEVTIRDAASDSEVVNAIREVLAAEDPGWFAEASAESQTALQDASYGFEAAAPQGTPLTTGQEFNASVAKDVSGGTQFGFEASSGLPVPPSSDPGSMGPEALLRDHRLSAALSQMVARGLDAVPADVLAYIRESNDEPLKGKIAEAVARDALEDLASLYGRSLPAEGSEELGLMFRTVRMVAASFRRYWFNDPGNKRDIVAGTHDVVARVRQRTYLSSCGLVAGVLVQSGVTPSDIASEALADLNARMEAARAAGKMMLADAIQHMVSVVSRVAAKEDYSERALLDLNAGFQNLGRTGPSLRLGELLPLPQERLAKRQEYYRRKAEALQKLYPWKNPDFQDAHKVAMSAVGRIFAARTYERYAGGNLVGPDGARMLASMPPPPTGRRGFPQPPSGSTRSAIDGLTTEEWRRRSEVGMPTAANDVLKSLGLDSWDALMARGRSAYHGMTVEFADPEGWLMSTLRPRFHGVSIRDMMRDEHAESARLFAGFRDKASWWTHYMGLDVPAGQKLLALQTTDRTYGTENGRVRNIARGKPEEERAKRKGFDAYSWRFLGQMRGIVTDVSFTREDQEVVDWMLKAVDRHYDGCRFMYTNVGDLSFTRHDVVEEGPDGPAPRLYDVSDYTVEKVRARASRGMMTPVDRALLRLAGVDDVSAQVPAVLLRSERDGGFGFYDLVASTIVSTLNVVAREYHEFSAVAAAYRESLDSGEDRGVRGLTPAQLAKLASGEINPLGEYDVNARILDILERMGVVVAMRQSASVVSVEGRTSRRRTRANVAKTGAVVMDLGKLEKFWNSDNGGCAAYRKLLAAGREADKLTFSSMGADAMVAFRKAYAFAKKHSWMTSGDGGLMNGLNSHVPFMAGTGAFKWMCERAGREKTDLERLTAVEREFLDTITAPDTRASTKQLRYLFDLFPVEEDNAADFCRAVRRGDYAYGSRKSQASGLALSADDVRSSHSVAAAIYRRLHELAFTRGSDAESRLRGFGGYKGALTIVDLFDREASTRAAATGCGLNADQMYRAHGVLPANMQIFHHVGYVMQTLANTFEFRNSLVGFLTSEDGHGRPIAYARPALEMSDEKDDGIPEALWGQLARWWAEANPGAGIVYRPELSGRANAALAYDRLMKGQKGGTYTVNGRKYRALDEKYMQGVRSIAQFATVADTASSDDSSARNALNVSEEYGYAKQLFSIMRAPGAGYQRNWFTRWAGFSKAATMQVSLFFKIATKWESTTAAVGALTALASNNPLKIGGLVRALTRAFGTRKAKEFERDLVTMEEVLRMMDTDDPFLEYCRDVCAAVGIELSEPEANPAEISQATVETEVRRLSRALSVVSGPLAKTVGGLLEGFMVRGSERQFTYVLNAVKIATAFQIAQKVSAEMERRGRTFDILHDLKPYADYVNAEIGGLSPLRYAWADRDFRMMMSCSMVSWPWTKGSWSAGGGELLEDMALGGHLTTPEVRAKLVGRWLRMYGEIMLGVPMLGQIICKALGKAMGWDDDRDKWFTWQNEGRIGTMAMDITPLLKGLSRIGFDRAKDLPVVGALVPAYTGTVDEGSPATSRDRYNTTGSRRYYLHFGKQGWEFVRWFTRPWEQMMSKLSMPLQKTLEGMAGYNLGSPEYDLPFSNMTFFERWTNPTTDGAWFNLLKSVVPFSFNSMASYGDAGALSVLGPVRMGASRRSVINDLKEALTAWADNDRTGPRGGYASGRYSAGGWLHNYNRVADILADARRNGISPEDALREAVGQAQIKYYRILYEELPKTLDADFDERRLRRAARALNRLGTKLKNAFASLKSQARHHGIDWKARTDFRQATGDALRAYLADPFRDDRPVDRRYDY